MRFSVFLSSSRPRLPTKQNASTRGASHLKNDFGVTTWRREWWARTICVRFYLGPENTMNGHQGDTNASGCLAYEPSTYNERSESDLDEPDKLPIDLSISYWELLTLVLAIVCHIIDVCIDFNVAYQYYKSEKHTYFVLTIIFIAVPSIVNTYMSLKMFVLHRWL